MKCKRAGHTNRPCTNIVNHFVQDVPHKIVPHHAAAAAAAAMTTSTTTPMATTTSEAVTVPPLISMFSLQ